MKKIIQHWPIAVDMSFVKAGFVALLLNSALYVVGQQPTQHNDVTTPLHLMKPDYPTPYGKPAPEVLNRIYTYLDAATPAKIINNKTKEEITDFSRINNDAVFAPGDFRLTSYEWGVTYAGMLNAGEATGDPRFTDYTKKRLKVIADVATYFRKQLASNPQPTSPVRSV
jgi:unsaturated rhamnogalacturonyl hydrolase